MDTEVRLRVRAAYGRFLYYPANRLAEGLAGLLGKKTLSLSEIKKLETLGFSVTYESEYENVSKIK